MIPKPIRANGQRLFIVPVDKNKIWVWAAFNPAMPIQALIEGPKPIRELREIAKKMKGFNVEKLVEQWKVRHRV